MSVHPAIGGIPLVLGGNVFGWTASDDESFAVLDAFYQAGGRMIDTADVYSAWVEGHRGGESERVIGAWLESRGVRGEMLIHTKTGMLGGKELYEPARVLRSLDASLERLRTDYLDLYYAHKDYPELPVEQIVEAFNGTIESGKVREIGASNFDAARLSAAVEAADASGRAAFTVLQNEYNLVSRDKYDEDLQALCTARGIAMLPFYGLAAGYLSGKYRTPEDFERGARSRSVRAYAEKGRPVLRVMDEIAAETGASLPAIALAWLVRQPGIPAPIASARTIEQLRDLLEFTRVQLSEDQVARLTESFSS
ncbi:aldo/keto reductase [Pelagerythrobacter aerophilus]|uniref:Aldo/keto reductase n=1 Tax=Pelagerythrobacter aerophilus TaxID=2306995 RepID=A0A418NJV3_9SPHN|nr:aldo/keto reductase [Pelagerythrobacter aerophilus]RIV79449.1 aldo/keto reductase [Pelagerythrobacter aerophilus]